MKRVIKRNINPDPWKKDGGDSLQVQYDRIDRQQLYEAFIPYIEPTDVILDIGIGGAREIRALRENGHKNEVWACDYFQEVIDFVTSKNDILDLDCTAIVDVRKDFTMPYDKNPDVILCFELIEHLDEPLELIKRLLSKTNKRLIITCPYGKHMAHPQHVWEIYPKDLRITDKCKVKIISIGSKNDHIMAIYDK